MFYNSSSSGIVIHHNNEGVELLVYAMLALKLILGLAALIIVTRILGKKEMSQVTPFDFVYAIVLGGLVEENLFSKKASSIWEMLFGIAVWGILIFIVEKTTQKSDKLRPILKGSAQPLVKDGEILIENLKKAELEMDQLKALLRLKGIFSMNDVKDVILETSGNISVLPKRESQTLTYAGLNLEAPPNGVAESVIDEGKPVKRGLSNLGKDERWLKEKLADGCIRDIDHIYFAEWSEANGFYIQYKNQC
jgi:uncharacterized membrane protein YcaP (DUF421 family)